MLPRLCYYNNALPSYLVEVSKEMFCLQLPVNTKAIFLSIDAKTRHCRLVGNSEFHSVVRLEHVIPNIGFEGVCFLG